MTLGKPTSFGTSGYGNGGTKRVIGQIKETPEDFLVEEIPAYLPCGDGEHLFLLLEKRGISAFALADLLAESLAIATSEIGMAGLKDSQALTRQWVSVPARCEARLASIDSSTVRVISASRHRNKLRTGHLRGNRFSIRLSGLQPDVHPDTFAPLVAHISKHGLPNFYGPQRFGDKGDTAAIGRALFTGQRREVPRHWLEPKAKRLALSALQAEVFNHIVMTRLEKYGFDTILAGDVLQKPNGALFIAQDLVAEKLRLAAREIQCTAPIFGNSTLMPESEAQAFEERELSAQAISRQALSGWGKTLPGARRAILLYPEELEIAAGNPGSVWFHFNLPPGAYATVVLAAFADISRSYSKLP